jgi:hypothetical protein
MVAEYRDVLLPNSELSIVQTAGCRTEIKDKGEEKPEPWKPYDACD